MPDTDLDADLVLLAQRFADACFVINTVTELRRSAHRLMVPLLDELTMIRSSLDTVLARLEDHQCPPR